jgi:hypothetical protein
MQTGKQHIVTTLPQPQLDYFKAAHFSPGGRLAAVGTTQDQTTVYLHALVCLYEVDYQQYEIDHPTA